MTQQETPTEEFMTNFLAKEAETDRAVMEGIRRGVATTFDRWPDKEPLSDWEQHVLVTEVSIAVDTLFALELSIADKAKVAEELAGIYVEEPMRLKSLVAYHMENIIWDALGRTNGVLGVALDR